jgi:hypothetical protein|tara:strand:+ start:197 stop:388 length:192 start_codon:yes stop_codon:yes gene_type:complete
MNTINSLVDWLTQSNSVLMNKNSELEKEITRLTTFIFELCDKDCPEDYKRIVQQEILKDDARD